MATMVLGARGVHWMRVKKVAWKSTRNEVSNKFMKVALGLIFTMSSG